MLDKIRTAGITIMQTILSPHLCPDFIKAVRKASLGPDSIKF